MNVDIANIMLIDTVIDTSLDSLSVSLTSFDNIT